MTDSTISDNNLKHRVVVLGGCGFIGRNLVDYLIKNDLVESLRVVDKTPPQLAWLNAEHAKIFEDPRVEYKSANLINPASCASALEAGEGGAWSLVVNCAGETRPEQSEAVYEEGIVTLSVNVARRCAASGVRLVELSTSYVYSGDKECHTEDSPIDPWTTEGKMKYRVEQELKNLEPELNYTVLRPPLVYGVGDRRSLTPRLLIGAIYKHLNETMKLLWTGDLKLNTVHVSDVCRAIWFVGTRSDTNHQIYNVVDDADSTQGSLAEIVADIFKISHDYYGTAMSTLAKSDIASVSEEANDKHLSAWAAACARHELAHCPLEPTLRPELLKRRNLRASAARLQALGYRTDVAAPTVQNVRQVLEDFAEMNLFPKALLL